MKLRALLILGAVFGYVSSTPDYDDLLAEEDWIGQLKMNVSTKNKDHMKTILIDRKYCASENKVWKCREECRRTFLSGNGTIPGLCSKPIPGDVCFGSPVDYPYVSTGNPFPLAYKVLENYPKCWSYLAPLLCTVHFRPCAVHKYALKREGLNAEDGIAELWATVRRGYCHQTVSACSDVINDGFFPEFINCDNATTSDPHFSDDCQISNLPVSYKFESKCPSPLVFVEGVVEGATPLHDSCYLQCGAEHVAKMRENQHKYQAIFGCFLAIVFGLAFAYLHFFSAVHRSSAVVFCAAQSLLSIAGFYALWGLSPLTATDVECVKADGLLLRATEPDHHFLHWCVTQAVLLHFFLTCAFVWISALAVLSLCKPRCLKTEKIHSFHLRSILTLIIYLFSYVYSVILHLFRMQETDGVSGVCLTGLLSSDRHAIIVVPPLVISLIAAGISLVVYFRRTRQFRNSAMTSTVDFGQRLEEYTRKRKRAGTEKERLDTTSIGEIGQSDEKKLILAEEGQEFDPEFEWGATRPTGPHMGTYNGVGFLAREYRSFLDKRPNFAGDDVPEDFYKKTAEQYASVVAEKFGPYRIVWYNSFGLYWTVATMLSAVLVLLLSLSLHPVYIAVDSQLEKTTVQDYVRYALDSSITRGSIEWAHDGRSEDAFSSCHLVSYLPAGRAGHVVLFYLVLPSLPFLVLVVAMMAGFCGRGGMKNVRATRWKGFETVQEPEDDEDIPFKKIPLQASPQCFSVTDTEPEEPGRGASTEPSVENGENAETPVVEKKESRETKEKTAPESTGLGTSKQEEQEDMYEEMKDEEEESEAEDTLSDLPMKLDVKKYCGKKVSKLFAAEHRRIVANLAKKIALLLENPKLPVPESMRELVNLFNSHGRNNRAAGLNSQKVRIYTTHQIHQMLNQFVANNEVSITNNGNTLFSVGTVLARSQQLYDVIFENGEPAVGDRAREAIAELMQLSQMARNILPELEKHLRDVTDWLKCNNSARNLLIEADNTLMGRGPPSARERQNAKDFAAHEHAAAQIPLQPSDFAAFQGAAAAAAPAAGEAVQNGVHPLQAALDAQLAQVAPAEQQPPAGAVAQPPPISAPAAQPTPQPLILRLGRQAAAPQGPQQPQGVPQPQERPLPVLTLPPALRAKANQPPQHNFSAFRGFGQPAAAPVQQQPQQGAQEREPQYAPAQEVPPAAAPKRAAANPAARHMERLRQLGAAAASPQPQPVAGPSVPVAQQQPQLNQDQPCSSRQGVAEQRPQATQSATSNLISAYAETYNPAPRGLITSFSDDELSVRISRMREFNSMQLYPQDFIFTLLLTGDVRLPVTEEDLQVEGVRHIPPSAFPALFGPAPDIESRYEPANFLRFMRRRAIVISSLIGSHFLQNGKRETYVPPVLPDLGFFDLNDLVLIQAIGQPAVLAMRDILHDHRYGDQMIRESLQLPEIGAFAAYLDHFATTMGFPHSREELIPDPGPPAPPRRQPTQRDEFLYSLSDHENEQEEED